MSPVFSPARWRITVKVPAVVALFMAVVSIVITNRVLDRLAVTQKRSFEDLAAVYLDALSSTVLPFLLRDDSWEVFDALDRASSLGRFGKVQVVVASETGEIIASTDPRIFRLTSAVPPSWVKSFGPGSDVKVNSATGTAEAKRRLTYQGRNLGTIYASFDVSNLLRERHEVLTTLVITNTLLALALMAAAYLAVRRMVAPIWVLSTHLARTGQGPVQPVPDSYLRRLSGEYGKLFGRFNAMAVAVNEREALAAKVADEERLKSLGRLASGMAHEINNPLGGLFNALNTLRRHGHDALARERSLGLLERGLAHIRDVVRATLVTYKADSARRPLSSGDIEDLRLLIEAEVHRKDLHLDWLNATEGEIPVPAGAARQATLNVLLNAVEASPTGGRLAFAARLQESELHVEVEDSGPGMDPLRKAYLEDQGSPESPAGDGLGLWIIRRLVSEIGGQIATAAGPDGVGTRVIVTFPLQAPEHERPRVDHLSGPETRLENDHVQ